MSLRLVKRPKSPHWIMRGTIRGVRFEESAGTSNRKRSEEIRAKREAELHTELIYGKQSTATFAHAVHSYLESGGSRRFLTPILDYFGTAPLTRIDQDALDTGAIRLFPSASPSIRRPDGKPYERPAGSDNWDTSAGSRSRRRSEERADALAFKISTPTIAAIPGRRGIIGKTATLVRFRS